MEVFGYEEIWSFTTIRKKSSTIHCLSVDAYLFDVMPHKVLCGCTLGMMDACGWFDLEQEVAKLPSGFGDSVVEW